MPCRHTGHSREWRSSSIVHWLWKLDVALVHDWIEMYTYMWKHGKMQAFCLSLNCSRHIPQRSTRMPATVRRTRTWPDAVTRRCSNSTRPTDMRSRSSGDSRVCSRAGPKKSLIRLAHSYCVDGLSNCATASSKSVISSCGTARGASCARSAAPESASSVDTVKLWESCNTGVASVFCSGSARVDAAGSTCRSPQDSNGVVRCSACAC